MATNQLDRQKDSLNITVELFKHASTISGVIATIYGTFLFSQLKELPPAFWFLVLGIVLFIIVAVFSVFALSNIAHYVGEGIYKLTGEGRVALWLTYVCFTGAFLCILIFTALNVNRLINQKTPPVDDAIKAYVEAYVSATIPKLLQHELNNAITVEIGHLSVQVDNQLQKALAGHDQQLRQYIDDRLKGIAPTPSSSGKPSP
jgi:hypothetical protein